MGQPGSTGKPDLSGWRFCEWGGTVPQVRGFWGFWWVLVSRLLWLCAPGANWSCWNDRRVRSGRGCHPSLALEDGLAGCGTLPPQGCFLSPFQGSGCSCIFCPRDESHGNRFCQPVGPLRRRGWFVSCRLCRSDRGLSLARRSVSRLHSVDPMLLVASSQ